MHFGAHVMEFGECFRGSLLSFTLSLRRILSSLLRSHSVGERIPSPPFPWRVEGSI